MVSILFCIAVCESGAEVFVKLVPDKCSFCLHSRGSHRSSPHLRMRLNVHPNAWSDSVSCDLTLWWGQQFLWSGWYPVGCAWETVGWHHVERNSGNRLDHDIQNRRGAFCGQKNCKTIILQKLISKILWNSNYMKASYKELGRSSLKGTPNIEDLHTVWPLKTHTNELE